METKKSLVNSKYARWGVLALISLTMFFAYFFVDVVAPLKELMTRDYGWSSEVFGGLGGAEFFLNVFVFFLIFSGIILDKMGIRFTMITSGVTMFIGALIKFYALTPGFSQTGFATFLNSFFVDIPASAKLAYIGFAIFGVGVEMAGITVSKTIVKWFKGKELALAMGLEMAIARLGVFAVFQLSPIFAKYGGVSNAMLWATAFIFIGLLSFLVYTFVDKRYDKEKGMMMDVEPEEQFRLKDLKELVTNVGFISIVLLCVLFYSAIFPFQKFATEMLQSRLNITIENAARLVSLFPIGAMILTPIIGYFLDRRGKGATMMFFGALLLTISHAIFALMPDSIFNYFVAIVTIIILGTAFSLVPASLWPSIPKVVKDRYLGSAYAVTFWVQNVGLFSVPILIGWSLSASNPGVDEAIRQGIEGAKYNYMVPELIFTAFGILAMIFALNLKRVDKKNNFGLDLPNKK